MLYVKDKFIDIRIKTNGNYDSSLNELLSEVCTNISFSCDALGEKTYKLIRKKSSYKKLWENIDIFRNKLFFLTIT